MFAITFFKVLDEYYPEVLRSSPSIGRQGKALRRQQMRRVVQSQLAAKSTICSFKSKDENTASNKSFAMQADEIEVTEEHHNSSRTLKGPARHVFSDDAIYLL